MSGLPSWILYPVVGLIFLAMWRQARTFSLSRLFVREEQHHRHVQRVLSKHPEGGDWASFSAWMEEQADDDHA